MLYMPYILSSTHYFGSNRISRNPGKYWDRVRERRKCCHLMQQLCSSSCCVYYRCSDSIRSITDGPDREIKGFPLDKGLGTN
jgi:hypothetical protein